MADEPKYDYGLSLRAENIVARLYINGAPVAFHADLRPMSWYRGVTRYLRSGTNSITVDYEPINVDTRSYTPHGGVMMYAELDQSEQSSTQARVDLFHGRFDETAQTLVATDTHILTGAPLVPQAGTMAGPERYAVTPVDMNYPDRDSGEHAQRVAFEFTIADDTLGTLPQDGAPELSDTPELRMALFEAYSTLHQSFANSDTEAYGKQMQAVLSRFAYVRGAKGREDELLAYQVQNNPLAGTEEERLAPLPPRLAFETGKLTWGAENRMVGLADAPIAYLGADGQKVRLVEVMFCQGADGALFVCHQK